MPHLPYRLAGAILGLCALILTPALAQERATAPSGATPAPLLKSFNAGDIRGELLTAAEGAALTAGGTAFAQIKLASDAGGRRGSAPAELLIEATQGEIVAVTGTGIKAEGEAKARRIKIEGLRKKRERVLLVEIRLPANTAEQAALKVTLSPEGTRGAAAPSPASAEIAWRVKDCAGGFYGALQQIRDNPQLQVSERWREAAKADPALSRSWLFAPKEERRRARRKRSRDDDVTSAMPKRREREVITEASKLVRAGKDPALDRDGHVGWVLSKMAGDLDSYLSQPRNPALCTGAAAFADWYSGRLADVVQRGERLGQLAADARLLAREKTEAALAAARALPAEAPAWGGLTLITVKAMTVGDDSLKGLAVTLGELAAIAPEALGKVRQAPTAYDALIQIRDAGFETTGMAEAVRNELRAALGAIDAAARLEIARTRHGEVQRAFEDRIKAIREAQTTHCVCQS